ncbi:MAG: alpha/beta fold hydrolase [Oscillochloris sp.]|nr:alpha/beta fold hydrolase [Oscillochloris sp.]
MDVFSKPEQRTHPPLAQHVAQIGAATVAYQTTGTGPSLVLIHGLAGSSRWWRHNVPVLAHHFRVYTVDLIGFGGSKGGTRFVLNEAPAILGAWMQQIVGEPAVLAGHSMGGLVAADLAASTPELITRLVLVNAAAMPLGRRYVRHVWGLAGRVALHQGQLPAGAAGR